jgi:Coenzyme PQQ synthesis protein D (PqqD)
MQQHAQMPANLNDAVFVTKAQASFTELLDQREAIILDLENLHYYTLNATGIFLWKLMRTCVAQTVSALASSYQTAFVVTETQAQADVLGFLNELQMHGLIAPGEMQALQPNKDLAIDLVTLPAYEAPQLKLANSLSQVVLSGSSTIATAAIATGG